MTCMRTSRWVAAGMLAVSATGLLGTAGVAAEVQEVTVTGRVQAGVEARCHLLPSPGRSPYLLIGGDPAVIRPGAHVVVRGRPDPGAVTTCMQGIPLRVSSAQLVEPGRGGH